MLVEMIEQGSPEWFEARIGIPTASCFDKILSPTGKPSTQAGAYMNKLLAEWLTGKPTNSDSNEWMLRGSELEADARKLYEFSTDVEVGQVGIVYKDESRLVSCSPDGLTPDGGLEIKAPAPHTHVEYLLAGKIPTKYIPQVQGSMYITGRPHWDFMSYHPEMTPLIIRVERDEAYIKLLDSSLTGFIEKMLVKREKLAGLQ